MQKTPMIYSDSFGHEHPLIRDHALTGAKHGFRSFWVTGDIRIIYLQEEDDVQFYDIGTHNQVYS